MILNPQGIMLILSVKRCTHIEHEFKLSKLEQCQLSNLVLEQHNMQHALLTARELKTKSSWKSLMTNMILQVNSRGRPPVEEKVATEPEKNVHFKDLDDMKGLIERQNCIIGEQKEEIKMLKKKVEDNEKVTSEIRSEFGEFRKRWQSTGDLPNAALQQTTDATVTKIETLVGAYNDIQDRLYEIDKSWKNNLIFYGIPMETSNSDYEDPLTTEEKIRGVIKRKLRISRDLHLSRVTRIVHGPEFRGQKPIQVFLK